MTLVALSASYGAGGSVVGPGLADRLGVPFVDRAIPVAVAERLEVSIDDAAAHYEGTGRNWLERFLTGFIGADTGAPAPVPPETLSTEDFRRATEEVLLAQAATGEGVILGRAGVILLREDPRALRVRLSGPPKRRIRQAMRLGGADEETATRAMHRLDRAHAAYAKQFYGVDLEDPSLYHLVIDSTALPLDGCAELIAAAARSLVAAPES